MAWLCHVVPVRITVPPDFADGLVELAGEPARQWVDRLPELAERFLDRWRLTLDGPPMHGLVGLAVPVRTADETPAVLKLSWQDGETRHEALALSIWDGKGTVRLLDHDDDHGVLLLERLDHTRSLLTADEDEAVEVCARLLHTLRTPAPPRVRTLRATAERWTRQLPQRPDLVPARLVDAAVALCRELGPTAGTDLTNEDLHYENVLRGQRARWLMIDPKPIAGDPEFGVIPLLWNRFDPAGLRRRFDRIVEIGELDPDLARAWTFVRAVDNWFWFTGAEREVCANIAKITSG